MSGIIDLAILINQQVDKSNNSSHGKDFSNSITHYQFANYKLSQSDLDINTHIEQLNKQINNLQDMRNSMNDIEDNIGSPIIEQIAAPLAELKTAIEKELQEVATKLEQLRDTKPKQSP